MRYGHDAPTELARTEDYPHLYRSMLTHPEVDLKELALKITVDGALGKEVAEQLLRKDSGLTAGLAEHLMVLLGSLRLEGVPRIVEPIPSASTAVILSPTHAFRPVARPLPPALLLPESRLEPEAIPGQLEFTSQFFAAAPKVEIVEPKHLVLLRRFLKNPKAVWTGTAQAQALVHVLQRRTSLLCVLRTGGGKSVLFASMPYIETGVTLVIYPLRALFLDQCIDSERRDPHRPFIRWTAKLEVRSGIVVAMIEQLTSPAFIYWCTTMKARRLLNRIVLDECHVIITASDYRPVMLGLRGLVQQEIPIICVSATVPPIMEQALCLSVGTPSWKVVRESTQRRNLHLRLAEYLSPTLALEALVAHVKLFQQRLQPGEGILILCRTYYDVNKVAEATSSAKYTSHMSEDEKDSVAEAWLSGSISTVVSTSALGTGVHHQACRYVIHYLMGYGFVPYGQEGGRAGRDDKDCLALMLYSRPYPDGNPVDVSGYEALKEMLDGDKCMRFYMSRYLDGEALQITCSSSGYAECGRCVEAMRRANLRAGTTLDSTDAPDTTRHVFKTVQLLNDLPDFASHDDIPIVPFRSPPRPAAPDIALPAEVLAVHAETAQEALDVAAYAARNPAPVGTPIQRDAESSRRRELASIQSEAAAELGFVPYTFPNLLAIKDIADNLCIACLVEKRRAVGHTFRRCPALDAQRSHYSLSVYPIDGVQYIDCKSRMRQDQPLPTDRTICVYCLWPTNSMHKHGYGIPPKSCVAGDIILPACWLVLHSPSAGPAAREAFVELKAKRQPHDFFAWLTKSHRELTWMGHRGRIFNMQRLYMWLVLTYNNLKVADS